MARSNTNLADTLMTIRMISHGPSGCFSICPNASVAEFSINCQLEEFY
ncbi:hypothetical protein [Mesorhizobium sp. M0578]